MLPEKSMKALRQQVLTAGGSIKPEIVFKNARIVNVFTNEIEENDIAVCEGMIVGIGSYSGEMEIDLEGAYVCPGLLDGHIHLESAMVSVEEFTKIVMPHGTVAVITDPHEIANVAGTVGIDYMLKSANKVPLDIYFMLPSCVPATALDEAGAELSAVDLDRYYHNERVLGLAEMMNSYGTIAADSDILDKIMGAKKSKKRIDGHAPNISAMGLNAYVTAGVTSDHECTNSIEAMDKLRRGQWIMIREGTAAKNLEALMPLFREPYYYRCMLVTDDKHPEELLKQGHIDAIIRKAISHGADPIKAIRMGSLHTAQYFGLKHYGAIAPGYLADMIVLSDLNSFEIKQVYKAGCLVGENGSFAYKKRMKMQKRNNYNRVFESFHMKPIEPSDLSLRAKGTKQRVITLTPRELTTSLIEVPVKKSYDSKVAEGVDLDADIIKIAVFERHKYTGHIGIGFLKGYGLKSGAVASSIAHDSHNLIVVGTNDKDIMIAANTVRENQGGMAVVDRGKVLGALALPIAGLMSDETAEEVNDKLEFLKEETRKLGVSDSIDAFMTLAFVSLPVIPNVRLNSYGLVDVNQQKVIHVFE